MTSFLPLALILLCLSIVVAVVAVLIARTADRQTRLHVARDPSEHFPDGGPA